MKWPLSAIAQASGGRLCGADVAVAGVSSDTRSIVPGHLFVALRGERFDAHDFLAQAVEKGAAAVLASAAGKVPAGLPAVLVDDTRLALGRLAAAWRARFALPVLAVTGSNGKTTTKEMIAAILKAEFAKDGGEAVLATRGNLNNDIGLPLTLLALNASHRAAVIEMGMNHPGEIDYLARVGAPGVALVTNAQRAHLQGMGGLDEVAREKGCIFNGLPAAGVAVVNADDPYAELWRSQAAGRRVLTFGIDRPADVQGTVQARGLEMQLAIAAPQGGVETSLRICGRHNARNAVAAAAACLAAGVSLAAVAAGLSAFGGVKGRLQRRDGGNGALVLDDTYNANPDSVRAGIDVLSSTPGRRILVLGDMGEIGEASARYHEEVGAYAKSRGIHRLFALGEAARLAARAFGEGSSHHAAPEELLAALRPELAPAATVLVKGSRFMKMERIAEALTGASLSPVLSPAGGGGESQTSPGDGNAMEGA